MGVLSCYREECGNIMCDRYNTKYGYICDSCFDELVSLGPQQNIQRFMDSYKPDVPPSESSEAFFNTIFIHRRD